MKKRAKERVYDVNWKRFLSCHGARIARYSLSHPSLVLVRRRCRCQRAKGFFFRACPLSLAPVDNACATQHCPLPAVRIGENASAEFTREAIGRTSSPPAICNPRGLILRGNDNLGTIRPPPLSPLFSFSLAFNDADRCGYPSTI